jgi:hypothetical protein
MSTRCDYVTKTRLANTNQKTCCTMELNDVYKEVKAYNGAIIIHFSRGIARTRCYNYIGCLYNQVTLRVNKRQQNQTHTHKRMDSNGSDEVCVVCMECPDFWAWSDCTVGVTPVHKACVCWPCMVKVAEGKRDKSTCPWCRAPVTTIQKVTRALLEAGASTQDALESMHVATPCRGVFAQPEVVQLPPQHVCMDCGMAVYFRNDVCGPCFIRWRHDQELRGERLRQLQGLCTSCELSVGLSASCHSCHVYRWGERIRPAPRLSLRERDLMLTLAARSMETESESTGQRDDYALRWSRWGIEVGASVVRETQVAPTGIAGGEQHVEVVAQNLNVQRRADGTAGLRFST